MKYDMVKIGINIRTLRKQLDYSIKTLAEKTDISPSFIGLTERGQKGMSTEKLCRIGDALNVTLDELIKGEFLNGQQAFKVEEDNKINIEKQIIAHLHGMSDEQKELVLQLVKAVSDYRRPNWQDDDNIKYD